MDKRRKILLIVAIILFILVLLAFFYPKKMAYCHRCNFDWGGAFVEDSNCFGVLYGSSYGSACGISVGKKCFGFEVREGYATNCV